MSSGDIRAVDNPISAIFDLADDVNAEAPKVKKLVTYATVFIVIWLSVDFLLILSTIGHNLLLGTFMLLLFVLGLMTLSLMLHVNDFFRYYTVRHRAIISVRDEDPVVFAPSGSSAADRLVRFLSMRNPYVAFVTGASAGGEAIAKGRSGTYYSFDVHAVGRPGRLWRAFGIGYPGYQMFIKCFDEAPTMDDVTSLRRAVLDVSSANRIPPSRAIALWTRREDDDLDESVYDAFTDGTLMFKHRSRTFASSMELVVENEDGSYEFIPFLADTGYFSTSRTH